MVVRVISLNATLADLCEAGMACATLSDHDLGLSRMDDNLDCVGCML